MELKKWNQYYWIEPKLNSWNMETQLFWMNMKEVSKYNNFRILLDRTMKKKNENYFLSFTNLIINLFKNQHKLNLFYFLIFFYFYNLLRSAFWKIHVHFMKFIFLKKFPYYKKIAMYLLLEIWRINYVIGDNHIFVVWRAKIYLANQLHCY